MASKADESSAGIFEQVLSPSIGLMNRLSYRAKFLLIFAVLLIPTLGLAVLQFRGTSESREFNYKEHVGVDYMVPLREVLHHVHRHRVLAVAVASGDTSFREAMTAEKAAVNAAIDKVEPVEKLHGGLLKTTERWKQAKDSWARVSALNEREDRDRVETANAELTAILVDLILNYVANYSNLILDPDLDSYWLMDAYVVKLPVLGDKTAQAASIGIRHSGSDTDRAVELAGVYKYDVQTASDLASINMVTSFKEVRNFGKKADLEANLRGPASAAVQAVQEQGELVKATFLAGGAVATMAQTRRVVEKTLETLDAVDALYQKVGPELDWLILKRVDKYERDRTVGILLTVAAELLCLFLFSGFYYSVRRAIASLRRGTGKMLAGTTERFQLETRDELAQIADSYNQINAALNEARNLRQRVERDNEELQSNIMDLLKIVSDASDGDLTVRATITTGALGNVSDAFNQLLQSLQKLMGDIRKQQNKTNEAISAVSAASRRMAQGATNQAREVVSASQLVERVSSEIERVSATALNAAGTAKRTEESAAAGTEAVQNVISGMESLRANVQAGAKKMKNLGDRSMEITGIVGVINRISEQTNMLALNAAIEAARAGEHGRGFSVVAEEVRKLAERTAQATQEIDKLVKAIQAETTETARAIEEQTQVVEQESAIVSRAGESLIKIRDVSTESSTLVSNISEVAKAQVDGTRKVAHVMEQISSIAKETQQGAEGTVATMGELIELANQLHQSINRFKL